MKKEKLQIGVITKSLISSSWVLDIIKKIQSSDLMELKLVLIKSETSTCTNYNGIKTTWLFERLLKQYIRLEDYFVSVENNAAKSAGLKPWIKNVKVINITDKTTEEKLEEVANLNLDILLNIDLNSTPEELIGLFKFGVVYNKITLPGHNENLPIDWFVINNHTCIELSLMCKNCNHSLPEKLLKVFFAPDSFFINRVRSQYLWKTSLIVMRGLNEIYRMKNEGKTLNTQNELSEFVSNNKIYKLSVLLVIKHFLFYIKKTIDNKINFRQWIILYNKNASKPGAIKDYKKIVPPGKNFWADPHIIKKDGSYYVFIEEYSFDSGKGHISVFEIDRNGNVGKPQIILEKPYHLSYPFIFEYKNNFYMIPESEQNGTVDIYKCTEFPLKWEFYKHMFADISAVDTTLTFYDGRWWVFLNKKVGDYLSYKDELYLYYSNSPLSDKWISHPKNPVVSDVRSARSAGKIYESKGSLIRPSQDCSVEYGYKVRLNKIIKMTKNDYAEMEFDVIEPNHNKNACGIHTLAKHENFTMLDCKMKRSKLLYQLNLPLTIQTNSF